MTSRILQYFMQPAECLALIQEAVEQLELQSWLISAGVVKRMELAMQRPSLFLSNNMPAYWIGLSRTQGSLAPLFTGSLVPAAWGWLLVEIPRQQDNTLYLAQLSAKSNWSDPVSGQLRENNTPIELFRVVSKIFRHQLSHPAFIRDTHLAIDKPCKGVWYSTGAAEWVHHGGRLRQEGVRNTVFTLKET